MSNLEQLRNIRKYKKRRRAVSRIGGFLAVTGFMLMLGVGGEGDISLLAIFLVGLTGCGLFGLGISIINFIQNHLEWETTLILFCSKNFNNIYAKKNIII